MNDLAMLIFVVVLFGPSMIFSDKNGNERFIYKGLLAMFVEKAIDMVKDVSNENK